MKFLILKEEEDGVDIILSCNNIDHNMCCCRDNVQLTYCDRKYATNRDKVNLEDALRIMEEKINFYDHGYIKNIIWYLEFIREYNLKESLNHIESFIKILRHEYDCNPRSRLYSFIDYLIPFVYGEYTKSALELAKNMNGILLSFTVSNAKDKLYIRVFVDYTIKTIQCNFFRHPLGVCPHIAGSYVRRLIPNDIKSCLSHNREQVLRKLLIERKLPYNKKVFDKFIKSNNVWINLNHSINMYMYTYYSLMCTEGECYFITSNPEVLIDRQTGNENKKTFDFITVRISINSHLFNRADQLKIIKTKKKTIDNLVLYSLKINKRYLKYKIPVNCLGVTDIILRKDSILEYKIQLKTELLKLEEEWEEGD